MKLLQQSKGLCFALAVSGASIVTTLALGNSGALGDEEATIDESALSTGNGKNLIYFINGFDCSSNDYREDQVAPLFIFFDLARSGRWDVIKGNFQKRDCYGSPLVAKASRTLFRRARELKQMGYQRVVFAGHSVGAWSIMIAAQRPDFMADELVLLAPANWGEQRNPMALTIPISLGTDRVSGLPSQHQEALGSRPLCEGHFRSRRPGNRYEANCPTPTFPIS